MVTEKAYDWIMDKMEEIDSRNRKGEIISQRARDMGVTSFDEFNEKVANYLVDPREKTVYYVGETKDMAIYFSLIMIAVPAGLAVLAEDGIKHSLDKIKAYTKGE